MHTNITSKYLSQSPNVQVTSNLKYDHQQYVVAKVIKNNNDHQQYVVAKVIKNNNSLMTKVPSLYLNQGEYLLFKSIFEVDYPLKQVLSFRTNYLCSPINVFDRWCDSESIVLSTMISSKRIGFSFLSN